MPWGWNTGEYGPIETPGRPDTSELHNAEVEPICKKYLELRYRLLPYNYTLMREACTGLPPMRADFLTSDIVKKLETLDARRAAVSATNAVPASPSGQSEK